MHVDVLYIHVHTLLICSFLFPKVRIYYVHMYNVIMYIHVHALIHVCIACSCTRTVCSDCACNYIHRIVGM